MSRSLNINIQTGIQEPLRGGGGGGRGIQEVDGGMMEASAEYGDVQGSGASWTGGVGRELGMRKGAVLGLDIVGDEFYNAQAGATVDTFMMGLERRRFESADPLPGVTKSTRY